MQCEVCSGNGEIVTDWERYLHSQPGDVGDEAVAECEECFGSGLDQKIFDDWCHELSRGVTEGDFAPISAGFVLVPELWEPFYRQGLTPRQAYLSAQQ